MIRESSSESDYAYRLIEQLVQDCPRRRAGSRDERRAQDIVQAELDRAGMPTRVEPFDFCDNLYRVIALHFGAGLLGSVIGRRAPLAALGLHVVGASYWAHSTHRSGVVHPMLPRGRSQNLLATLPAEGIPALRVVVAAHIDAGFTGVMFGSRLLHDLSGAMSGGGLDWLDQPLALATYSQLALAGLDLLQLTGRARGRLAGLLRAGLTIPSLISFLLSADVAQRDHVVPGANDDLSGVAGALLLARRFANKKPANVELVFAITGAEEVGLAAGSPTTRWTLGSMACPTAGCATSSKVRSSGCACPNGSARSSNKSPNPSSASMGCRLSISLSAAPMCTRFAGAASTESVWAASIQLWARRVTTTNQAIRQPTSTWLS